MSRWSSSKYTYRYRTEPNEQIAKAARRGDVEVLEKAIDDRDYEWHWATWDKAVRESTKKKKVDALKCLFDFKSDWSIKSTKYLRKMLGNKWNSKIKKTFTLHFDYGDEPSIKRDQLILEALDHQNYDAAEFIGGPDLSAYLYANRAQNIKNLVSGRREIEPALNWFNDQGVKIPVDTVLKKSYKYAHDSGAVNAVNWALDRNYQFDRDDIKQAINKRKTKTIRVLVDKAGVSPTDSALITSVSCKDYKTIKTLIKNGGDPNTTESEWHPFDKLLNHSIYNSRGRDVMRSAFALFRSNDIEIEPYIDDLYEFALDKDLDGIIRWLYDHDFYASDSDLSQKAHEVLVDLGYPRDEIKETLALTMI